MTRHLLIVGALLLSGCSAANGAPHGTPGPITIRTTDSFRFVPDHVTAKAGDIRILLRNDGSYPHNLSLPALHVTSASVTGTPGSQTTELDLHHIKPGTYSFICTYHSEAGMAGVLTVTP